MFLFVILFVFAIMIVMGIILAVKINEVVRNVRTLTPYVGNLSEMIKNQEHEIEVTPKSVNGMTSVYLPKIEKDFPEFNYAEFRIKAENMIKSMFAAISDKDESKLINASNELRTGVQSAISANTNNRINEVYKDVTIHQTEIKDYIKESGTCVITLQSSVGYIHYKKSYSGEVVEGTIDSLTQTRYNTKLLYVQDEMKYGEHVSAKGLTCPNCGAPVTSLGNKYCEYCGGKVIEINIKSWMFYECREVWFYLIIPSKCPFKSLKRVSSMVFAKTVTSLPSKANWNLIEPRYEPI